MIRTLVIILLSILSFVGNAQSGSHSYSDAFAAFEEGNFQVAADILSTLIASDHEPESYLLRGDCFHKMEEFEFALADYNFAAQLNSQDKELFLNRGICKISLGMLEEGQSDISTYLSDNKESSIAWYYLAVISYHSYDNEESIDYLDKALAYNPTYMEALYLKAANLTEMKKWNQAVRTYELVLKMKPDFHRIRLNLALINMELNEFEQAIDDLDILRLKDLDFLDEVYFYRAEAKYSIHDKVGACEDWQEAAKLGDEDAIKNIKNICEKGNNRLKKRKATYVAF